MQPLDQDEFVDAGMRLYESLSQNEKNVILHFGKNKGKVDHDLQKCTFAPNINSSNIPPRVNDKHPKPEAQVNRKQLQSQR
jgi:hypothetical protein